MKIYSLNFVIRLLGRSRKHTLQMIVGYAIIIAIIISTYSIISGFSTTIYGLTEQAGQSNRFIIRSQKDGSYLPVSLVNNLTKNEFLTVLPLAKSPCFISNENFYIKTQLIGTNLSHLLDFYHSSLEKGFLPVHNNSHIGGILGSEISDQFLYQTINCTIQGNIEISSKIAISGSMTRTDSFNQAILVHLEDYINILNKTIDSVDFIEIHIKTDRFISLNEFQEIITKIIPENLIEYSIWNEQQADVFTKTLLSDIFIRLNLLFIILLLIATIRLFHGITWYTMTYEQIYLVLRSIGMSKKSLFINIIILSQFVGNLAFIAGVFFGYSFSPLLVSVISVILNSSFFTTPISLLELVLLWFFSLVIITLASVYPSYRVSKIPPSKIASLIKYR